MQRDDYIAGIFLTNHIIEVLASLSTGSSVYISTNKKRLGAAKFRPDRDRANDFLRGGHHLARSAVCQGVV